MRKAFIQGLSLFVVIGFCFQAGYSAEKIELEIYGIANANISFPNGISHSPSIGNYSSYIRDEIKPYFYSPVLTQNSKTGFGGRIALNITPRFALELSYENNRSALQFKPEAAEDLIIKMESIGYTPYFDIKESGGSIKRIYGNFVYNIFTGKITVYVSGGGGIAMFKVVPNFKIERMDEFNELADLHYNNAYSPTFNGGIGMKYYFSRNLGLRIDARAFSSFPAFKQSFKYSWLGYTFIPEGESAAQNGLHLDIAFNLGIIFRL